MNINGKEINRSYIIAGSILVVGIILAIVLYVVFRGDADKDGKNSDSFFGVLTTLIEQQPSGASPLSGGVVIKEDQEGGEETTLFRVSEEPVVGATLSSDGTHVRYFKHATGHLFEAEFTGKNEMRISNVTIPAIQSVQWTPSKKYAVISYYADGATRRLYSQYSGTSTIISAFLPNDIQEITTSRVDDMISYAVSSGGETRLFTARPDNTGIKNVFSTPIADFELAWPSAALISLKTKSSAYAPSFLYTINPSSKQITRLLADKTGLDVLWSPSGERALAVETSREGTEVSLYIVTLKNNTTTNLPFVTLPEKCAWALSEKPVAVYCAIPEAIPAGTVLPDEWWQGNVSFNDALWHINAETGERQQLLPPRQLDATHLFLSKDESFLFFTNKKDGLLWSLRLK